MNSERLGPGSAPIARTISAHLYNETQSCKRRERDSNPISDQFKVSRSLVGKLLALFFVCAENYIQEREAN
jgi:hypothetical protein